MLKKFFYGVIIVLVVSFFLPLKVWAKIGVGVTTGKITVEEKLRPGIIYQLPPLTIVNTGDEEGDYEPAVSYHQDQKELRPAQNWFEFSPKKFHLKPGEAQKVEIKLNLPIKIEPGEYFAYLEGHPVAKSESGQTTIGVAAAAKLYFTVLPANPVLGVYYKVASIWKLNQPWSSRIAGAISLLVIYLAMRKYLGFQISFGGKKKEEKESPDE